MFASRTIIHRMNRRIGNTEDIIERILAVADQSIERPSQADQPLTARPWYFIGWIVLTEAWLGPHLVSLRNEPDVELPVSFAAPIEIASPQTVGAGTTSRGECGGQLTITDQVPAQQLYDNLVRAVDELISQLRSEDESVLYRVELELRECRSTDFRPKPTDLRLRSNVWHAAEEPPASHYVS
ncbi:MAG: hypothetical protein ACREDR_03925 [Blastocatellia bacterium]